jgi:hypothetical protein
VDDLSALGLYPRPPKQLEDHMAASVWLMRDVGWEPDFPSTAAIARVLLMLGQDRQADSVIAITPQAFVKVAEALGGIATPHGTLGPGELLPALEAGTDAQGRGFMDVVFQGLLQTVNGPGATSAALDVAQSLARALDERHILVNMVDPAAQAAVMAHGWDGALTPARDASLGDVLAVVDSNVGWSKVDRNIQRSVDYSLTLEPGMRPLADLQLTYSNLSGPEATGCESQEMDRGSAYSLLKNTCYWNFLRVFVAPDTELINAPRMPLPPNSIQSETGGRGVGADTFETGFLAGRRYFGGLGTVPPHEQRTIRYTYSLPGSAVEWNEAGARYVLDVQKQAGTSGRQVSISLNLPDGYAYAGSNLLPSLALDRRVDFEFLLRRDTLLTVDLMKKGPGS